MCKSNILFCMAISLSLAACNDLFDVNANSVRAPAAAAAPVPLAASHSTLNSSMGSALVSQNPMPGFLASWLGTETLGSSSLYQKGSWLGLGTTSPLAPFHVAGSVTFQGPSPFVDVKAFGAKGDGMTDDTAAIRAALDFARSTGVNPIVLFPAGRYMVQGNPAITIRYPVHLVGSAGDLYGGTSIWSGTTNGHIFDIVENGAGSSIEGIALRVNGTPVEGSAGINISLTNSLNGSGTTPVRLENVSISNLWDAIVIQSGNNIYMSQLNLMANLHNGISIGSGAINLFLSQSNILDCANIGIEMRGAPAFWINNIQIWRGKHGIVFSGVAQIFGQGVAVDSTSDDGFIVENSVDLDFADSWVGGSHGHGIALTNTNNFHWTGGFIRSNVKSGVFINSGNRNLSFANAGISANGWNNGSGSDTYGIYVYQPMINLKVVNNFFGDLGEDKTNTCQTYALFFNAAAAASANTAVIQGNQHFNDNFTNTYTSPWTIAGNAEHVNWQVGGGLAGGSCATGSLFSNINGGAGSTLYVCVNRAWVNVK